MYVKNALLNASLAQVLVVVRLVMEIEYFPKSSVFAKVLLFLPIILMTRIVTVIDIIYL
jgi:hypothetical protein